MLVIQTLHCLFVCYRLSVIVLLICDQRS